MGKYEADDCLPLTSASMKLACKKKREDKTSQTMQSTSYSHSLVNLLCKVIDDVIVASKMREEIKQYAVLA